MRTRSSTRVTGLSPGRDHALPPPTRKPKKAKLPKVKECGQVPVAVAAGCEPTFHHILNTIIPGANKAVLLEWLGLLFFILFLHVMSNNTASLTGRAAYKRGAEDDTVGPPARRRRVEPATLPAHVHVDSSTPPVSKSGGAIRRLLASVTRPRRPWGFSQTLRSRQTSTATIVPESNTSLFEKHASAMVKPALTTPFTITSNRTSSTTKSQTLRKRQISKATVASETNTPLFEKHASATSMETLNNIVSTVEHHETNSQRKRQRYTTTIASETNTPPFETHASATSMETPPRKRQKSTATIAPESNTPLFAEKHTSATSMETPNNIASTVEHHETTNPVTPKRTTRRHKRKRSPTPEVIPNPPGTSYGMWDKYFMVDSSSSEDDDDDEDVEMKDVTPTPDPATIRYPHNTSGVGVFCVNLDDILDAAEKEEAELAEAELAAVVPDALAKARALALKHKPETSSRLRFVERLSTSTVGTDLHEEVGIQPQGEEDEVSAAVAAIPEGDLLEFNFPRAPPPGVAEEEVWRAVAAAAAGTPGKEVLPLFG